MGFYENLRDGVVERNIVKYGMPMTLKASDADVHDPVTGAVTLGAVKSYSVKGIMYPEKRGQKKDVTAKTARVGLSPSGMTVIPTVSHRLVVGAQEFEIMAVHPLAPGGVTVWYDLDLVMP